MHDNLLTRKQREANAMIEAEREQADRDAKHAAKVAARIAQIRAAKPLADLAAGSHPEPHDGSRPTFTPRTLAVRPTTTDDYIVTHVGPRAIVTRTPGGRRTERVKAHREQVRRLIDARLRSVGGIAGTPLASPIGAASPRTTRQSFAWSERALRRAELDDLLNGAAGRVLWAYPDVQRRVTAHARELRGMGRESRPATTARSAAKVAARKVDPLRDAAIAASGGQRAALSMTDPIGSGTARQRDRGRLAQI